MNIISIFIMSSTQYNIGNLLQWLQLENLVEFGSNFEEILTYPHVSNSDLN